MCFSHGGHSGLRWRPAGGRVGLRPHAEALHVRADPPGLPAAPLPLHHLLCHYPPPEIPAVYSHPAVSRYQSLSPPWSLTYLQSRSVVSFPYVSYQGLNPLIRFAWSRVSRSRSRNSIMSNCRFLNTAVEEYFVVFFLTPRIQILLSFFGFAQNGNSSAMS